MFSNSHVKLAEGRDSMCISKMLFWGGCPHRHQPLHHYSSPVPQKPWIPMNAQSAESHGVGHVPAAPNGAHDSGSQAVANVMIKTVQGSFLLAFPILRPHWGPSPGNPKSTGAMDAEKNKAQSMISHGRWKKWGQPWGIYGSWIVNHSVSWL